MKKLLTLLAITAAFSLLPSISQATCVQTGTIPRIFVQTHLAGFPTNIGLRANGLGALLYNFTTTNSNFINAALTAEASHITVQIVGNAAVCPVPPAGGFGNGGTVISILVSP